MLSLNLLKEALTVEIPMKGAIAYGTQTADFEKSLHFGRPLVDAYLLSEELQLYGVVLHHTMESYLREHKLINAVVKTHAIQYKTPLKKCSVNHYCLNWTKMLNSAQDKPYEIVSKLYDTVSGSTRHYVDNTLEFVNTIEASKPKQ